MYFTIMNYLEVLGEFSGKIYRQEVTEEDFIALQKMSARIVQLHSDGQLSRRQYRALYDMCADLIDAARDALRR